MAIEGSTASFEPRIKLGMVGGGSGAFIGAVHRIAARIDDKYELVAGALSSTPEKARQSGAELGWTVEFAAIRKGAGDIDCRSAFRNSPLPDSIEVLQGQTQRIENGMAIHAGGIGGVGRHCLTHGSGRTARRDSHRGNIWRRIGRIHTEDIFQYPYSSRDR